MRDHHHRRTSSPSTPRQPASPAAATGKNRTEFHPGYRVEACERFRKRAIMDAWKGGAAVITPARADLIGKQSGKRWSG
jgi:hypothetical protein